MAKKLGVFPPLSEDGSARITSASRDDVTGTTQGKRGQFCTSVEKAPANTGVSLVGGDTCRGRAERMVLVQTNSSCDKFE